MFFNGLIIFWFLNCCSWQRVLYVVYPHPLTDLVSWTFVHDIVNITIFSRCFSSVNRSPSITKRHATYCLSFINCKYSNSSCFKLWTRLICFWEDNKVIGSRGYQSMCTSFGANPVALLMWLSWTYTTCNGCSSPSCRFELTTCDSILHTVWFNLSTHPFVWGWKKLVSRFFDPKLSYTYCATWAVNSFPPSESNNLGHPHLVTYSFAKMLAHHFAVFSSAVNAYGSAWRQNKSTIKIMYLFPFMVFGNGHNISNDTISPGEDGSGSEINGQCGARRVAFAAWDTRQWRLHHFKLDDIPIHR